MESHQPAFLLGYRPVSLHPSRLVSSHDSPRPRPLPVATTPTPTSTRPRSQTPLRMAQSAPEAGTQRLADILDIVPQEYRPLCFTLPANTTIVPEGKRRTKVVATIGPSTETEQDLLRLAAEGVNLIRLNMSHGSYSWHEHILAAVRKINVESPFVLGTMVDIGSLDMVRLGEISGGKMLLEKNDSLTITTKHMPEYPVGTTEVSFDGFLNVASKGDLIVIDNSVELIVKDIVDEDAHCEVSVGGQVNSRSSIAIRGKSYQLLGAQAEDALCEVDSGCHPVLDIEFAIKEKVDYISLSFVESEQPINELKATLAENNISIGIVAKIESASALENLDEIVSAADVVMVARGDLGTAIPYQYVPVWQERIVKMCRAMGKPCLVSTHFLESMTVYPTPTRAEVADIAEAVNQATDGLVLTSETASGKHPYKAVSVMNAVANKIEEQMDERPNQLTVLPTLFEASRQDEWATSATKIAENIASSASLLSSRVKPRAILVFTQKGLMASLLSRSKPQAPIFAFTPRPSVRSRLSLLRGVRPFRITFDDDPEATIGNAIAALKLRKMVKSGDEVLVVADVLGGSHGAPHEEIRKAFDDIASISGSKDTIPRSMLRLALRQMGLKTSDAVETALGMSEEDYMMSEVEGASSVAKRPVFGINIDFERFQLVVDEAVEIVHTIQLRTV